MTSSEQPKESCQECIFFKKKVCSGAAICPVPRSRPHPAPAQNIGISCEKCKKIRAQDTHGNREDWTQVLNDAWMDERDERIRTEATRKTREDVLDNIIEHRKTMSKICDVQTAWEKEGLLLISLRHTTPNSEHGGSE